MSASRARAGREHEPARRRAPRMMGMCRKVSGACLIGLPLSKSGMSWASKEIVVKDYNFLNKMRIHESLLM